MRKILSRGWWAAGAVFAAVALAAGSGAFASDVNPGWGGWWLPPDRSEHGHGIDSLFVWIFWITMVIFVAVEIVLVVFLVKYRYRPERKKAVFTHGNTRLEMTWTIAPAIILAVLALFSKKVWDNYRFSPIGEDPSRTTVLVIGEQFKWNTIYPGPDGKLGRYMIYPRPTDTAWQNPDGSGKPYVFQNVKGPAELPAKEAQAAIKAYISGVNLLGKDFDDPDGKDDDYKGALARIIILPKGRPIEIQLGSKDVIHDFFLPNFRVKLDAVPGMRGKIHFQSTMSSAEREKESRRPYSLDEALEIANRLGEKNNLTLVITEQTPQTESFKPRQGPAYRRYADKDKQTIARHGSIITPLVVEKLKVLGVAEVDAFIPGTWELVCEELCGAGHTTMRGEVRIVDNDEYDALKLDKPYRPAEQPAPPVQVGTATR